MSDALSQIPEAVAAASILLTTWVGGDRGDPTPNLGLVGRQSQIARVKLK
jgi:hypothetical protein